jgi:hypothetical protein
MDFSWEGSLHQTFRYFGKSSENLSVFLSSNGKTPDEVLSSLPYDAKRSRGANNATPDPKRYRDGKQVYQTIGLLYEDQAKLHVTEFGNAALRWQPLINQANFKIFSKHALMALSVCQLRNPSASGQKYPNTIEVFPFAFIWEAMLSLGGRISSDELNRSLFKVQNYNELLKSIANIRRSREEGNVDLLGDETISGERKNDRIIPWMSLASFGWTIFPDKRGASERNFYEISTETVSLVESVLFMRRKHSNFQNLKDYCLYIPENACLPRDFR